MPAKFQYVPMLALQVAAEVAEPKPVPAPVFLGAYAAMLLAAKALPALAKPVLQ